MNKLMVGLAVLCLFTSNAWGQSMSKQYDPGYKKRQSSSLVQDKNFYLLTLFQKIPEVKTLLTEDKVLLEFRKEKLETIKKAIESGAQDRAGVVNAFLWSDEEIRQIGEHLKGLSKKESTLKKLFQQHLQPSGTYQVWASLPEGEILNKAWELCAKGINHSIQVYGNGAKPLYPAIDSVTYNVENNTYKNTLHMWAREVLAQAEKSELFFDGPLDFAVSLLYLNHRDEAARYEPMEILENKAAVDFIPSIHWKDYPYASIVVLGAGSEMYGVRLTPNGKLNLRIAARQFQEGLAPLLIVSGGHVHPYRTPVCEAIEMKKELMEKYGIQEKHILIEPHARHTTTNLRNASRLLYAYGVPEEKPSLVTTNYRHSDYVGSQKFQDRCIEELGYLPGKLLERISPTTIEFLPIVESFHQNPYEPLDP
ncbi:YdcF family protein [Rapidithrix thailandica]|uniref:YdcF family protein n=1 Tax=Rapidithrix thailandica TaxID=413964 RepID=A0AAW9SKD7_9BACT